MKLFFLGKKNGAMIEHCRTNISMPIIYMIDRKPFHIDVLFFWRYSILLPVHDTFLFGFSFRRCPCFQSLFREVINFFFFLWKDKYIVNFLFILLHVVYNDYMSQSRIYFIRGKNKTGQNIPTNLILISKSSKKLSNSLTKKIIKEIIYKKDLKFQSLAYIEYHTSLYHVSKCWFFITIKPSCLNNIIK